MLNQDQTDSFSRRLGLISDLGRQATVRQQQQNSLRSRPQSPVGQTQSPVGQTQLPTGGGGNQLESFINAISSKESGGNYGAVNRSSGALGKYQIMPSNIPGWSQQALGRRISTQEFLGNPELQEKVARHQLTSYYNQYGPGGAAVAWYAGPGKVKNYQAGGAGLNKSQGAYPTINAYAEAILRRMGQS